MNYETYALIAIGQIIPEIPVMQLVRYDRIYLNI